MSTKSLNPRDFKGIFFIRDYIIYRGKSPTLREISKHMGFGSSRSAALLIQRLVDLGYLERTAMGSLRLLKDLGGRTETERIVEIPLVGSVPCGLPLLAEENIEAWVPVSQRIAKPGAQYFLLRATGDSMNKSGIKDGDLLVVRQQPVADSGERVVALIGDDATVKEFQRKGDKVILMPRSSNPAHKPIILEGDFMVQGVVINSIPNPLN